MKTILFVSLCILFLALLFCFIIVIETWIRVHSYKCENENIYVKKSQYSEKQTFAIFACVCFKIYRFYSYIFEESFPDDKIVLSLCSFYRFYDSMFDYSVWLKRYVFLKW